MKTKNEYAYILKWAKKIKSINLLGGKCEKCGENRIWVLEFHHADNNKEIDIGKISNYRWSTIEIEIKKCNLLCGNCHRKIHNTNVNRNSESKNKLLELKCIYGCERCKYNDYNGSLDFHHIKNKDFNIGKIRIGENSCEDVKNKIISELNKCIVLCSNCHKDIHFDKEKFEKYKDEIYKWEYKEFQKPIDKNLVIKMYNEGKKQVEITKELKCAKSTICGIIKKYKKEKSY